MKTKNGKKELTNDGKIKTKTAIAKTFKQLH